MYSQKITFNGKSYVSVDQMPAPDREVFEKLTRFFADENNNGVPDRFEASGQFEVGKCTVSAKVSQGAQEILINGKSYANPDAMSDEDRRIYQGALALLDKNNNGVPDAFEVLSKDEMQKAFGEPKCEGACGSMMKWMAVAALCTAFYFVWTMF